MSAKRQARLRLDERDPFDVAVALAHPYQLAATDLIRDLLAELRACHQAAAYEHFQRILIEHVYEADVRRAEARTCQARDRRGQLVPSSTIGWDREVMVADRVSRQLRTVGDALAWRLFSFDRRPLITLGNNSVAGSIVGKKGLASELDAITESWEQRGNFALLHDITNTLRLGDITEFTEQGPRVAEVKASAGSSSGSRAGRQRRRLRAAIDAVNEGTPFTSDGTRLFETAVPLRTRLRQLKPLFERSPSEGLVVEAIDDRFIVTIMDSRVGETIERHEEATHRYTSSMASLRAEHLKPDDYILDGYNIDASDCTALVAPHSIFPFDPVTCAQLVTNRLTIRATVGWSRLAAPFQRLGWKTHSPLDSHNPGPADPALVATKGDFTLTLHRDAVVQALVELHDLDQFAAAFIDGISNQQPGGGFIVFADEDKVWH